MWDHYESEYFYLLLFVSNNKSDEYTGGLMSIGGFGGVDTTARKSSYTDSGRRYCLCEIFNLMLEF